MEKVIKLLFIGAIFINMSGCKKISTPNEESKKIFGKWNYEHNTGGWSGSGGSNRFCDDCWIEITEKGCFTVYEGDDKISKTKFTIEMIESIYDGSQRPALVYKDGFRDSYQVNGDNLTLSDETYDGYTYQFIKK
jgi:hypothetical protein